MKKISALIFSILLEFCSAGYATSLAGHKSMLIGDYKITALSDGLVSVPLWSYQGDKNYRQIEKKILRKNHVAINNKSILISLNAYLIQHNGKNILVDTGSGGMLPPKSDNGFLVKSLHEIDVAPSQINAILITHLHPDHIGGLLTSSGKKQFPNATLYINQTGWKFWHSDRAEAKLPQFYRAWFTLARKEVAAYKGHIHLFSAKKQMLLPGIEAIPLPGHTPGHTGYLIKPKQGSELLIWGDTVHVSLFEFSHPSWSMVFDVNRKEAAKEHVAIMKWAANNHVLVAGMHLKFPGVGYVVKKGRAFKFIPFVMKGSHTKMVVKRLPPILQ